MTVSPKKDRNPAQGSNGFRENPKVISVFDRPKNLTLWFLTMLVVVGLIFLIFNGYHEFQKMKQLAQKRGTLLQFNQEMNQRNEEIYRKINRLKRDPVYLEEIARKEFGLVKQDEIIFFLEEGRKEEGHKKEVP
jgi:cell division protein FtsB